MRRALPVVFGLVAAALLAVLAGGAAVPGGQAQLWTVLITGLTAGGLSCLAVQGGLLASALKRSTPASTAPASSTPIGSARADPDAARTIGAFLVAKLVAYTLLGALLGLFGSVVELSPFARGVMQILIGLFMLATGIRMVYPHPWLRWVVIEPPAGIRRRIRRLAKDSDDAAGAAVLGALTVLIPCGVTQAMMAIAISSGNPLGGALIMALFTLGTSPLFFVLSYAATTLGKGVERQFNKIVAVLVIILGYVAVQTGFALAGHPLPVRPVFVGLTPASSPVHTELQSDGSQRATVTVLETKYVPNSIDAEPNKLLKLRFVSDNLSGCTRSLSIPKLDLQRALPATGTTTVTVPAQPPGSKLRWVCGMGMYSGTLHFAGAKG